MRACSCRISALPTGCESGRDRRLCLKRSRLALALVAAALVIGAIALTLRDAFPPGEPGGVVDAEPGPELAHAAATKEPIEELKRVPVDGAHAPDAASVLAEPAPTVPADPPSDAALAELKSVVSTELRSFGEALQLAEAKAGDSEAAYVEFLQVQLRYRMRQEVQQSLEQGEAVLVRAGAQKSVFSREYIRYSTSQKLRNAAAEICVPVLEKSAVLELRKNLQARRESLLQSVVATHNVKHEPDRHAARACFESGQGLPGLPASLAEQVSYRMRFLDGDFLQIVR